MMKQNAGKRIDNILIKLPESMRDRIEKLPAQTLQQLEEIRIRTNTDTLLISGGREYSLRDGDEITAEVLEEILNRLLDYSYYAYEEELSRGYITIEGYDHICDKIRHMLLGAEKRIYFSATGEFLEQWSEEIRELVRAQKKVVLISEDNREPFPEDAELKAGIIEYLVPEHFREPKEEEQQMDQIRLIIDSEYILTGTVTGKSSDTCLYSGQKNFVRVFKDAMRNEIALIRLKQGEQ